MFSMIGYVLAALASAILFRRLGSTGLSLLRFDLDHEATGPRAKFIDIQGRPPGILGFLLSLFGIYAITTLTVTRTEARYRAQGLFADVSAIIPMHQVTFLGAVYFLPFDLFLAAGLFGLGGLLAILSFEVIHMIAGVVLLALGVASVMLVSLRKLFYIQIRAAGPADIALVFSPSIIEGMPITYERTLHACEMIRAVVLQAPTPVREAGEPEPLPLPPMAAAQPEPVRSVRSVQAVPAVPAVVQPVEEFAPEEETLASGNPEQDEREATAQQVLDVAKQLIEAGMKKDAREQLKYLVQYYPDTRAGAKALAALNKGGN